jgi:hypothetical protein
MKLYIAKGYNSYTNKQLLKAFSSEAEATQFLNGLTDPRLEVMSYRSTVDLVNDLLKGV